MLLALLVLATFGDLTVVLPPKGTSFADPEWVVAESDGFSGTYVFDFALYRDGNVVYSDAEGNLAQVRLDAARRRALLRELPIIAFDRLPAVINGMRADDESTYWMVHWTKTGGKHEVQLNGEGRQRKPFWTIYQRLRTFRALDATILEYARTEVIFSPVGAPPCAPFPPGWPSTLPKLARQRCQLSVVIEHQQLAAMRAFARRLDSKRWRWNEYSITPPAPHQAMWITWPPPPASTPAKLDAAKQTR